MEHEPHEESLSGDLDYAGLTTVRDAQIPATPRAISTPDKVETRLGSLDFKDGAPNAEAVAKIYDNLDFTRAFDAKAYARPCGQSRVSVRNMNNGVRCRPASDHQWDGRVCS